jgi:hypothetical protein
MDQVVHLPLALAEADDVGGELVRERVQVLFAHVGRRPGRVVDDADAADPLGDLGQALAVPPGEDINGVTQGRQVLADLADVDILAAAVHTP